VDDTISRTLEMMLRMKYIKDTRDGGTKDHTISLNGAISRILEMVVPRIMQYP
jgi:hypothetical protein